MFSVFLCVKFLQLFKTPLPEVLVNPALIYFLKTAQFPFNLFDVILPLLIATE